MDVVVCDCEVFEHFFCMVGYECLTDTTVVCCTDKQLQEFYHKHKNAVWCFYNASYDRYIVKYALLGASTHELKQLNDYIIEGKNNGYDFPVLKGHYRSYPMCVYDAKTTTNGLKTLEAYLGLNIHETSVPFNLDRPLTPKEKREVIDYCKDDVAATLQVLKLERNKFKAHWLLLKEFNLPREHMSKTMGRLAAIIVGAAKDRRWVGEWDVKFPEHVLQLGNFSFVADWFKYQISQGQAGEQVSTSLDVDIYGLPTSFAWGGAHGALKRYTTTGKIAAWDVTSLYPSIMIKYNLISRNIPNPYLFADIYRKRVEYKKAGNELNVPYKLAINSLYGLHGDKYSSVYDPSMGKSICVTGQLLILDLAVHLGELAQKLGAKLIQINTDAVYVEYFNDADLDKLEQVALEWQQRTGMELERDDYVKLVQRDVNNYIMVDKDGHVKGRGPDCKAPSVLDADLPIIRHAIRDYLAFGIPVEKTINDCEYLMPFQKVFKRQGKYTQVLHNGKYYDETTFRVFASTDTNDTCLYKINGENNRPAVFANCPKHCFILNDNIANVKCLDKLDKEWYINEAKRRLMAFEMDN